MDITEFSWPEKVFITGIDTDAGKSYATGHLANLINSTGGNAITMKMVQTGNDGYSEDIAVHREIMGMELAEADKKSLTAPEIFTYPCSPELAARIDGREIDLNKITSASEALLNEYSTVLIEGAGGLMVPLKGQYLTIDYIRENKLPAILVTNGKLGSISHTLLALYALKKYGINLIGVIYNTYFDYDKIIAEDTRNYIRRWLQTHFEDAFFLEM
ncbi:MAG: dethiobiotin synthase [Muribaculaceae bacterium]|nr:dethiobiotin synthase [Muribaculaceae bacterium]